MRGRGQWREQLIPPIVASSDSYAAPRLGEGELCTVVLCDILVHSKPSRFYKAVLHTSHREREVGGYVWLKDNKFTSIRTLINVNFM